MIRSTCKCEEVIGDKKREGVDQRAELVAQTRVHVMLLPTGRSEANADK